MADNKTDDWHLGYEAGRQSLIADGWLPREKKPGIRAAELLLVTQAADTIAKIVSKVAERERA